MPLPRPDKARDPEFDRLCRRRAAGPLGELLQRLVEQDADWLARRLPGKRLVDRFVPEFHAHDANGRVGHHLGQPDELEVECAEGGVCVLDGRRHEAADEVSIVVACPADGKRLEKEDFFKRQEQ